MFVLVDCNNFYASCERVFQPKLNKRPIIVLSNNDGCVIARSNEAKALGIGMAQPFFECRDTIRRHKIAVFSANFALYGDMSARVMNVIASFTPDIEIYSIDEAFLKFNGLQDFEKLAQKIRDRIKQWTGIPVSIGVAPTKTLAKLAATAAKNRDGVFLFPQINSEKSFKFLSSFEIEKIWGIGYRWAARLHQKGIHTALDLKNAAKDFVRRSLNVVGLKIHYELNGISCFRLESMPTRHKGIMTSRTFGKPLTKLEPLQEAVAEFATRSAEKLRKEKLVTQTLSVYIRTEKHSAESFYKSHTHEFLVATSDTSEIIAAVLNSLKKIYVPNIKYKRAAVILGHLLPENQIQTSLLDDRDRQRRQKTMQALDQVNGLFGRDTLKMAACGTKREWQSKQRQLSPRYTTRWDEILEV